MARVLLVASCLSLSAATAQATVEHGMLGRGWQWISMDGAETSSFSTQYWNDGAKEQFGDAAWIARHGVIPMVFVIKDANENPMCLEYLDLYRHVGASRTLLQRIDANQNISSDQFYYFGSFGLNDIGAPVPVVGDTVLFEWELRFRDFGCLMSHLSHYYNRVTVGQPLPSLLNWYRTDTHYHTRFTDNIFEFGGFMWMVRQSAEAVGLDVVCLTDHSTDIKTSNDEFGWSKLLAEAASLSDGTVLLIPGEELTLDSDELNQPTGQENRIHMVVSGLTRPLLAPEECCSQNSSGQLWTLRQGLDSVAVQNAVAMAAHPSRTFSVGYGGALTVWSDTNFDIAATYQAFAGLESFNERRTVFNNAVENDDNLYPFDWVFNPDWESVWEDALTQFIGLVQRYLEPAPRPFSVSGGSDAHGDFDNKYSNQYGITGKYANDDAIGKVHTLVYSPSGLNQAGILDGIRNRHMVMSDGPAFTLWVDRDGNGSTDGTVGELYAFEPDAMIRLEGAALEGEHGPFTLARIYHLTPSAVESTTVALSGTSLDLNLVAGQFAEPGTWSAIIVNARTENGYQATTSPIYVAPQGAVSVEEPPTTLSCSAPRPNPTSGSVSFTITVPDAMNARVEIFNIAGRRVLHHNLGTIQPGSTTYTWDGRGDSGVRAPEGLYLVRFLMHETALVRRTVVVR